MKLKVNLDKDSKGNLIIDPCGNINLNIKIVDLQSDDLVFRKPELLIEKIEIFLNNEFLKVKKSKK